MRLLISTFLALATGSAAAAHAVQAPAATATRPQASVIEDLGNLAVDAYELARTADWERATVTVAALKATSGRLDAAKHEDAAVARELDGAISALDQAVSNRDLPAAMHEANLLTRVAAEMGRSSEPAVPVDVTRLDYYGRELEIWASVRDVAKLRSTVVDLASTWQRLRPQAVSRGGSDVATRFDLLVEAAGSATGADGFAPLATPILDEVDHLETVFARKAGR